MSREGALKAWATRRANAKKKVDVKPAQIKDYDTKNKDLFRKKVLELFNDIETDDYCLLLETPQCLFVNNIRKRCVVFEHNHTQYVKLVSSSPSNVELIFNCDIGKASKIEQVFDCAFLDFCGTFDGCKHILTKLKDKLRDCKKIAFTFGLRRNKKVMNDYKFDLVKRLQDLFPNFTLEFAHAYRDGAPMVGIVLNKVKHHSKQLQKGWDKLFLMFFKPLGKGRFQDKETGEIFEEEKDIFSKQKDNLNKFGKGIVNFSSEETKRLTLLLKEYDEKKKNEKELVESQTNQTLKKLILHFFQPLGGGLWKDKTTGEIIRSRQV